MKTCISVRDVTLKLDNASIDNKYISFFMG